MRSTVVRLVLVCVTMLGVASAHAQDEVRGAQREGEQTRIALVIGNGDYDYAGFLPNPTKDAQAMADALRELGFEVFLGLDLNKDNFEQLLRQYTRALDAADVGLFFYAGHGLQVDGINYIIPTDAVLERASDLDFEAIDSSIILNQFNRPDFTGLVFLDACRDNPLARSMQTGTRSVGRGLAEVTSATGTLIAYATQPGNVAYDGDGDHSPFTTALLSHISTPGMEIRLMLDFVGEDVAEMTRGQQQPWVHFSRLRGGFYFKPEPAATTPTTDGGQGTQVVVNENDPAVRFYEYASALEVPQERLLMLEQFIRLYPTHPLAVLAATDVQELRTRAANPDPDRTDLEPGQQNTPPRVEAARTLTLDADAGPTPLAIAAPTDEDGDELTVTLIALPEVGHVRSVSVPVSAGDQITPGELTGLDYTPDVDAVGAVGELRYRVDDGKGGTAEGVVRITLRAPNQPPIVQDLLTLTIEQSETPTPLGIAAPIDPDNDRLQIRVTWLPRAGTVELNGRPLARDEELTAYQLIALSYRPDADRAGDMGSFEYQVDDGRGGLIRATVRITVVMPNTPPTVADETLVEVPADQAGAPLNLTPPTDADGDPLTIRVTWTPRWGSVMSGDAVLSRGDELSVEEFASLRYFAAAGQDGDAGSFEFAVTDGRGDPVRGMVRISVIAPNQPPRVPASQDITVAAEAGAARLEFERPEDADGDALVATVTEIPFRGRLTVAGRTVRAGDLLDEATLAGLAYEPALGHVGAAGQFAFTVTDGTSDPVAAVVRISVESTNSPPVVDSGRVVVVRQGAVTPLGLAEPRDPDGDSLTVRVLQVPNGGFVRLGSTVVRAGQTLSADEVAALDFELTAPELRTALFSYEADDGRGGVATGSIELEVEEVSIVTAPPGQDLAGNTPAFAYDIGAFDHQSRVFEDRVDTTDPEDWFRVSFADWTEVEIVLTGLSGDLDLFLYTADDFAAASSEQVGEVDESIVTTVPAGTYFVRVLAFEDAASPYTMTISARSGTPPPPDQVGNTPQEATMLGTPSATPIVMSERVDVTDRDDYYAFDVPDYMDVTIRLTGLSGDLDLELLEPTGRVIASSQEGGWADEAIVANLAAGRYHIHVFPYSGQSNYQLSLEGIPSSPPPPDGAGDSVDTAAMLGTLRGSASFTDWVGPADQNDYIGFDLAARATLTARMTGLSGDADIELMDETGGYIASSSNVETQDEEIVVELDPGRYYIRVYPFEGQTDYRLELTETSIGASQIQTAESLAQLRAWEESWSRDERRQVQRALQLLGHYNSSIDGLFGSGSRNAINAYQQSLGEPATGYLTRDQRAALSVDAAEEAEARAEAAANQARAAANSSNAQVLNFSGGDVYRGDANRVGYGTYEWASGHRYEGQWNGAREGFGVLILQDGSRYSGQWQNHIFVGFGTGIESDGTQIIGEWNVAPDTLFADGLNGYGEIVYTDFTIDRGEFINGVMVPQ
ncbi:MAG: caspase family protein [Alphaproteobacteria bacterium]